MLLCSLLLLYLMCYKLSSVCQFLSQALDVKASFPCSFPLKGWSMFNFDLSLVPCPSWEKKKTTSSVIHGGRIRSQVGVALSL